MDPAQVSGEDAARIPALMILELWLGNDGGPDSWPAHESVALRVSFP